MAKRDPRISTEVETTGHEWDGVTELNKPLPKWWLSGLTRRALDRFLARNCGADFVASQG